MTPNSTLTHSVLRAGWIALLLLAISGCIQVKTEPIRIEPIYIEITINHRIQRELDDLFGQIDRESDTMNYQPLENGEKK